MIHLHTPPLQVDGSLLLTAVVIQHISPLSTSQCHFSLRALSYSAVFSCQADQLTGSAAGRGLILQLLLMFQRFHWWIWDVKHWWLCSIGASCWLQLFMCIQRLSFFLFTVHEQRKARGHFSARRNNHTAAFEALVLHRKNKRFLKICPPPPSNYLYKHNCPLVWTSHRVSKQNNTKVILRLLYLQIIWMLCSVWFNVSVCKTFGFCVQVSICGLGGLQLGLFTVYLLEAVPRLSSVTCIFIWSSLLHVCQFCSGPAHSHLFPLVFISGVHQPRSIYSISLCFSLRWSIKCVFTPRPVSIVRPRGSVHLLLRLILWSVHLSADLASFC